jgi:hypothetical protein
MGLREEMAYLKTTEISGTPTANVQKQNGAKRMRKPNSPVHFDSQYPFFTCLIFAGTQEQL